MRATFQCLNSLRRVVSARGAVTPMPDGDFTVHATETSTVVELPQHPLDLCAKVGSRPGAKNAGEAAHVC